MSSEAHVCDTCPVVRGEADARECCEGCPNKMELINYVPKHLREDLHP